MVESSIESCPRKESLDLDLEGLGLSPLLPIPFFPVALDLLERKEPRDFLVLFVRLEFIDGTEGMEATDLW